MGKRADALELARFLAFDGQEAEAIGRALQLEFGLDEGEAMRMALNVMAPPSDEAPRPTAAEFGSLLPPY